MRSEQPSSPAPKPEAQPLATTLRTALDRGELAVLYQARYDLRTLRPAGAEATLRLRESEANGRTAPITLGLGDEHAALLIELGRYLLSAACAKLAKHQRDRTRELRVAVDVCGPLLATPDFPAFVQQVLSEHDLPPRCLELQVGERALAFDSSACGAALAALGEQGVRLSFDDFLIADAQVSRLRDYDVDTLKLDGTFVREIERSRRDAAAARGVIEFAHRLGLEVVASGVETEAQLELLRSAGCDLAQGHLLSQPAAELPGDRPRARTRSAENALPAPPPPRSGH
jgi:EAL domain-containing protein (putative c-di-GMP-specific phosphodiesterase class I)